MTFRKDGIPVKPAGSRSSASPLRGWKPAFILPSMVRVLELQRTEPPDCRFDWTQPTSAGRYE